MRIAESNVALLANVNLWLGNNDSLSRQIRFYMPQNTTGAFPGLNTYYSSFEAGNQVGTYEYVLPLRSGSIGDVLTIQGINGKKVSLVWQTPTPNEAEEEHHSSQGISQPIDDQRELLLELQRKTEELERTQQQLQEAVKALQQAKTYQEDLIDRIERLEDTSAH